MKKDIYLFYSGATDKTGQALAEALDVSHGKTPPKTTPKILISWGAKTDEALTLPKTTIVLNHPDNIRLNRNKLEALNKMRAAKINVAPFIAGDQVMRGLDQRVVSTPLIARSNFHQGGENFVLCVTKKHVADTVRLFTESIKKGFYFQNFIDIDTEYRLHIVFGELICAVKKVPRDNIEEAHVEQQTEKIQAMATKKGQQLDPKTLEFALKYQAGKISGPDLIIKSNTRGYKFSQIKPESVPKDLVDQAVKALKALNLDFGAVDCVIDTEKKPFIIEVNTGPGLEGTTFKAYAEALARRIAEIENPPKASLVDKAKAAMGIGGTATKPLPTAHQGGNLIDPAKLRMLADLMDNCATQDEKSAVNSVAKRMFGG